MADYISGYTGAEIDLSVSFNNEILLLITSIIFVSLKIGFGILAKSENSLTKFSIWLICLLIVFK